MKHLIISLAILLAGVPILLGSANDRDFDLVVEEGHSLEDLMASYGCVIYESEPFSIFVNGREIICNLNTISELSGKDMARVQRMFEDKLNANSSINLCWLHLSDLHNTYVGHLRIGTDPFGFYPDLPAAQFDNHGNLLRLSSYDINKGYFQYTFLYDADDRITHAEERCYEVSLSTGRRSQDFTTCAKEWRYNSDGTYMQVSRKWDGQPVEENLKTVIYHKCSGDVPSSSVVYNTEAEFMKDEKTQAEWQAADSIR